jgi:hypothetical protein
MAQYIRFQQTFFQDAQFVVPYCMTPVIEVGGKRCPRVCLCFSYRQSAPWPSPTPIPSPTRSTCASGTVLCSQLLPPGALSNGVVSDSAGPLVLFRQKQRVSGQEGTWQTQGPNYESTKTDSPPYLPTQVSEYQKGRLDRGRTWTHVLWTESPLAQARTKTPSACQNTDNKTLRFTRS